MSVLIFDNLWFSYEIWRRHDMGTHDWPLVMGMHQSTVTLPSINIFNGRLVGLNKSLNNHSSCWWVDTPWRSCNVTARINIFAGVFLHTLYDKVCSLSITISIRKMTPHLSCTQIQPIQWHSHNDTADIHSGCSKCLHFDRVGCSTDSHQYLIGIVHIQFHAEYVHFQINS